MTTTPYSGQLYSFSQTSHRIARRQLYPEFFGTEDILWKIPGGKTDSSSKLYDRKLNVDVIALVKNKSYKGRLKFLIQERFVGINYLKYNDITITEWNTKTDQPSEMYKMAAGFFLYTA